MNILFTYLTSFKGHGGIEKFNKAFIYALGKSPFAVSLKINSAYDIKPSEKYVKPALFEGHAGSRVSYLLHSLRIAFSSDMLIIGHINLALIGVVAKALRPKLNLICVTHGIDVWYRLSFFKKLLLSKADHILSVSNFTKKKLISRHKVSAEKISIFPNTFDPYFQFPVSFERPDYLVQRYEIADAQRVLLSVCRLSAKEGYKGYDTVISALPSIVSIFPDLTYIIVGKYDQVEYDRLIALATELKVEKHLLLTGFVPDQELTDHYLLADVFTMPSREEGFGIVYIEAMACGLPVIAGNADGSVDALDNGNLGTLVDPTNTSAIAQSVISILKAPLASKQKMDLQRRVVEKFGFDKFYARLEQLLSQIEINHVRH